MCVTKRMVNVFAAKVLVVLVATNVCRATTTIRHVNLAIAPLRVVRPLPVTIPANVIVSLISLENNVPYVVLVTLIIRNVYVSISTKFDDSHT